MTRKSFIVNGQAIPFSFWQKVVNAVGDKHLANRIFFRAEQAKARDVVLWISKGLSKDTPYALRASRIEAEPGGGAICDKWINERIEGSNSVRAGMQQFNEILKGMIK